MRTTEKFVDGKSQGFALKVPQSNIDAGKCSSVNSPTARLIVVIDLCPDGFVIHRVTTDQKFLRHFVYERYHLMIVAEPTRITESILAVISVDLYDNPIAVRVMVGRGKNKRFNIRYLHG